MRRREMNSRGSTIHPNNTSRARPSEDPARPFNYFIQPPLPLLPLAFAQSPLSSSPSPNFAALLPRCFLAEFPQRFVVNARTTVPHGSTAPHELQYLVRPVRGLSMLLFRSPCARRVIETDPSTVSRLLNNAPDSYNTSTGLPHSREVRSLCEQDLIPSPLSEYHSEGPYINSVRVPPIQAKAIRTVKSSFDLSVRSSRSVRVPERANPRKSRKVI